MVLLFQPVEVASHITLSDIPLTAFSGVYLEPAIPSLHPGEGVRFVQPPYLDALFIERSQAARGWGQSHYRHGLLSFAQLTQFGGGLRVLRRQYLRHVFPNDQGFVVIGLAVINPAYNPNRHT